MYRRLVAVALAIWLAMALPLVVLAGQQPISGTPTWQDVPNLGEEYGYYWTDVDGNTDFVVCDQNGEPLSIYLETVTANTAYKTVTQNVTTTTDTQVDVMPPTILSFLYPAAGPDRGVGWGIGGYGEGATTERIVSSDGNNDGYGVFEIIQDNAYPVNMTFLGSANPDWNAGNSIDTTATVPDGIWFVRVPLNYQSSWSYEDLDHILASASVNDMEYNGQPYYLWDNTNATFAAGFTNLEILSYPGYSVQGSGNLGVWQPGFVEEQKFVPAVNASVGTLQDYAAPTNLFTLVSSSNVSPYVELSDWTIHITWADPGNGWIYPSHFSGYIDGTFTNNTPLLATITSSGNSVSWSGEFQYQWGVAGGLAMPSGITVPPNTTVNVELPIWGSTWDFIGGPGNLPLISFTDSAGWWTYLGNIRLTSADGRKYAFYSTGHYTGGGESWGDFESDNGVWIQLGSPVLGGSDVSTIPSTALTVPMTFIS